MDYNKIKMERNLPQGTKLQPARSSKHQIYTMLPALQKHKLSITDDQQRYISRTLKPFDHEETNKYNPEDKIKGIDVTLSVSKETPKYYKRMRVTPAKVAVRQKASEKFETDIMRKQFQQIKNNHYSRDKMMLSSIMECIEKEVGTHWKIINDNKYSNRAIMYQPYKKKTSNNNRQKSKSHIHESQMQSNQSCFFNVEKISLLESDKTKKSSTINIENKTAAKKKDYKQNSLIKEINIIKQKLNLQRIVALNEELQGEEDRLLRDAIKISPCNIRDSRLNQHRSASSNGQEYPSVKQSHVPSEDGDNKSPDTQDFINTEKEPLSEQQEAFKLIRKTSNVPSRKIRRKFIVPFQTYYYRDLLWKANFANGLYVEVPLQYEHRLKVFVGRGNNSCMVKGLISRRPWYAFTDRIEEANFVWTQIKSLPFFKKQDPSLQQQQFLSLPTAHYQAESILTDVDKKLISSYLQIHMYSEQHNDERLLSRSKIFKYRKVIKIAEIKQTKMQNHLINNYVLGNKKALFNTMSNYYRENNQQVFDFLPLTFHIKDGLEDKVYFQFLRYYHKRTKEIAKHNQLNGNKNKQYNAWIVKPGENSNRGNGIKMCLNLQQIKAVLKQRQRYADGTYRTYIVQAYIQRPLLYFKRKFDLRHYMMITSINGLIKGYWYRQGYVRTTSSQYSLKDNNGSIHLTNDAVQKNLPQYGKYEKGNKLSYEQLSNYIEKYHKNKGKGFYETIYKKMKVIATDAIRACSGGIDPSKLNNNFEIFGLDFMIDSNLDVWLIEINTNPCLQLSCPLLSSLIPRMVQNALELTLDCMFPPPVRYSPKGLHYFKQLQKENKFELVYDQRVQKLYTGSLEVLDNKLLEEEDDIFEDSGDQWEDY